MWSGSNPSLPATGWIPGPPSRSGALARRTGIRRPLPWKSSTTRPCRFRETMPRISAVNLWRTLRPVLAPVVLCALVILILREPLAWWLSGEEKYDQEALKEWLREATISQTLPELVANYIAQVKQVKQWKSQQPDPKLHEKIISGEQALEIKREE